MKKNVFRQAFFAAALAVCLIAQPNISLATLWNGIDVNIQSYSASNSNPFAQIVGSSLQLTNGVDEAATAWAVTPVSTTSSFTTTFSFDLQTPDPRIIYYDPASGAPLFELLSMGDGITLAFQSTSNTALGLGGASLGAFGGSILSNTVGSAVQTWTNNRLGLFQGDPGDLSNYIKPTTPLDLGAADSVTGTETVSYNAATHTLSMAGSITVNGVDIYPVSDSLSIDLSSLGPSMYVGFTGGSGLGGSTQDITAWNGINTPTTSAPEPATMLLLGLGLIGLAGVRRKIKK